MSPGEFGRNGFSEDGGAERPRPLDHPGIRQGNVIPIDWRGAGGSKGARISACQHRSPTRAVVGHSRSNQGHHRNVGYVRSSISCGIVMRSTALLVSFPVVNRDCSRRGHAALRATVVNTCVPIRLSALRNVTVRRRPARRRQCRQSIRTSRDGLARSRDKVTAAVHRGVTCRLKHFCLWAKSTTACARRKFRPISIPLPPRRAFWKRPATTVRSSRKGEACSRPSGAVAELEFFLEVCA